MNLQLFGGRGGRSGGGGGARQAVGTSAGQTVAQENATNATSAAERKRAQGIINRESFTDMGGGMWDFNKGESVGLYSRIMDETQTAAGGYGRYRQYSVRAYDFTNNGETTTRYFDTLNEAKRAARSMMTELLNKRQ